LDLRKFARQKPLGEHRFYSLGGETIAALCCEQTVSDFANSRDTIIDAQRNPADQRQRIQALEYPLKAPRCLSGQAFWTSADLPRELARLHTRNILILAEIRFVQ
jgi:hypothetical protein